MERMCEYFNHFHRVATRYEDSAHLLVVRPAYGQLRMRNGLLGYLRCRTFGPVSC